MTQLSQLLCSELIGKIFNFCPIFIEICSRARGVITSNVAGDGGGGLPLNITIFYCIAPGARRLHLRIQCLEFIKIAFLARSQEIYIIIPCGRRREKVEIKLKKMSSNVKRFVSHTNRNNVDEFQFTYFPKIFLVIQNMNFKILRHSDPNYTVAYVVHIYIIIIV